MSVKALEPRYLLVPIVHCHGLQVGIHMTFVGSLVSPSPHPKVQWISVPKGGFRTNDLPEGSLLFFYFVFLCTLSIGLKKTIGDQSRPPSGNNGRGRMCQLLSTCVGRY